MHKQLCKYFRNQVKGRNGAITIIKIIAVIFHVGYGIFDELSDWIYLIITEFKIPILKDIAYFFLFGQIVVTVLAWSYIIANVVIQLNIKRSLH